MLKQKLDKSSNYQPEIDGLRAIAISFVLLFHLFPTKFKGGFIGVDVFFVISGYLITIILSNDIRNNKFSIANFYSHRITRIFPALLLVLISTGLYAWFFLFPDQYLDIAKHIAASSSFSSNYLLWRETGYFSTQNELKPLMHLWSLAVEEQFYIIWPILIFILSNISNRFLLIASITLFGVSLSYEIFQTYKDYSLAFYSPLSRSWELLAGCILAFSKNQFNKNNYKKSKIITSHVGFISLILLPFWVTGGEKYPGFQALAPVLATLLIIIGTQAAGTIRTILVNPVLIYIGLISYPIYLWHWFFISIFKINGITPTIINKSYVIVCTIFCAILTYKFIEIPIRNRRSSKWVVLILISLMLITFSVFFASYKWGFIVRPTTVLRTQLSVQPDIESAYRFKKCFLDTSKQNSENFLEECTEVSINNYPLVLIWGDSLAAHTYPGLYALREHKNLPIRIAQRTATSCAPGLSNDYSNNGSCDEINHSTRKFIEKNHPSIVIINGRWESGSKTVLERISQVVSYLKKENVRKIILVGPAPNWSPDLRIMLRDKKFSDNKLPLMMQLSNDDWSTFERKDTEIKLIALSLDVEYISPKQVFCNLDSCRIKVSESIPDGLLVGDRDHLTKQGSISLFENQIVKKLFN